MFETRVTFPLCFRGFNTEHFVYPHIANNPFDLASTCQLTWDLTGLGILPENGSAPIISACNHYSLVKLHIQYYCVSISHLVCHAKAHNSHLKMKIARYEVGMQG